MWVVEIAQAPKLGNTVEEYEDASAHDGGRFAIADGASESSFSDRWAKLLSTAFVERPFAMTVDGSELREWLKPLQLEWTQSIDWNALPWYAARKAESGAFSSFLGLELLGNNPENDSMWMKRLAAEVPWRAFAVGDSCLFQVRDDALINAFPLQHAEQFGNRPVLISSRPSPCDDGSEGYSTCQGQARWNDLFLLATDALAQWFLTESEKGTKPWEILMENVALEAFHRFLAELRQQRAIRNDDTTLLSISIR
jgi:hypothetical protein